MKKYSKLDKQTSAAKAMVIRVLMIVFLFLLKFGTIQRGFYQLQPI